MPPSRAFWKGYLKLSLVTCPVAMTPAITDGEKIRFRTLNRSTGNPIISRYVDGETGEPVEDDDAVMGYETAQDEFVLLEEDELEAVQLESTRTIDIRQFVPRESVGSIWRDRPHYLVPDDKVGEEAFAVIRQGMVETRTAGLSQVVLYRRERRVLLEPRDRGIVLWTLRDAGQVRDADEYFGKLKEEAAPKDMLKVARSVIAERTRAWDASMLGDRVQDRLHEIIAAKQKGAKPAKRKAPAEGRSAGNVIDIMDALRRSLAGERKPKR
ncbi:non-homologous end joining protein Ku [Allostella vacuolata]|nr:non-homologous end joining protein Ku [Stella vacuolata]